MASGIFPQYLKEAEIYVTIIEMKSPDHFVLKESACLDISSAAKEFIEMEEAMQIYYRSVEHDFAQLPTKDSVVVVCKEHKFYRARVKSILGLVRGFLIKVCLVDYGEIASVKREQIFEIQPDFLLLPFQAVDFRLLDVEPMSLVINQETMMGEYNTINTWDVSAVSFVQALLENPALNNVHIIVKGFNDEFIFGSLYVTFGESEVTCLNEKLVQSKFASYKVDIWNGVKKLDDYLHPSEHQSDNIEPDPASSLHKTPLFEGEKGNYLHPSAHQSDNIEPDPASSLHKTPLFEGEKNMHYAERVQFLLQRKNPSLDSIDSGTQQEMNERTTIDEMKTEPESKVIEPNVAGGRRHSKILELYKNLQSPPKVSESPPCIPISSPSAISSNGIASTQSLQHMKNGTPAVQPVKELCSDENNAKEIPQRSNILNFYRTLQTSPPQNKCIQSSSSGCPNREVQEEKDSSLDEECAMSPKEKSNTSLEKKPPGPNFQDMRNFLRKHMNPPTNIPDPPNPPEEAKTPQEELYDESESPDDILQLALNPQSHGDRETVLSNRSSSRKSSVESDLFSDVSLEKKITFDDRSLWEKQRVPALCLGIAIPQPVLSVAEAGFPHQLQKVLQDIQFFGPSSIQSVCWPAFNRMRCFAAIAPPHSGKTVAYLLPLVLNFFSEIVYSTLPQGTGPIVVILCSSWEKVQSVFDLLQIFSANSKVKVLSFFADGRSRNSKVLSLLNGCDILISTTSCLLDFFKEDALCLKRCCHFILDDGNSLLVHHLNEVKDIMLQLGRGIRLRPPLPYPLQTVICAERWSRAVASFVNKFMRSPLLFFTSFLESAIYSRVQMFPHVCQVDHKKHKLLNILQSNLKTVICTFSADDAREIHNFLKCEHVRSFLVTEELEHYISNGIVQDWKCVRSSSSPYCLVVSDGACVDVSDALCLVHYDVPQMSRMQFGNRFSHIAQNFKDETKSCISHIFLSGECVHQAAALIKIIRRCGVEVPQDLRDLANAQPKESIASEVLCPNLKAVGICEQPSCPLRHTLDPALDRPHVLPSEGDIQGMVTHVFSATHFTVRLLKHLAPGAGQAVCMRGSYAKVGFQLRNYFSDSARMVEGRVDTPVVGGSYVLHENNLFYRVKVLSITPASPSKLQKMTLVFEDEGWVKCYDSAPLLLCPASLQLPPPHAVEVFLCGVSTPDSCPRWNPQANRYMHNLLKNQQVHGKIALCLGHSLWLHPMVLREKLAHLNDFLNVLKLDRALIEAGFAKENKQHLQMLYKACGEHIPRPKSTASIVQSVADVKVSHAFLELNVLEDVFVSSVVSPSKLYVQRDKFVKCLDDLLDTINTEVEKKSLKKCKNICKGMYCIAPFDEDNRWYRALVIGVDEKEVELFYVDFGDRGTAPLHSPLYLLPPEYALLPFQAIECQLEGVGADHNARTFLYDLTRDESGDMKLLQLKAYTKSERLEGGYHYTVDVWCGGTSFSHQLVEAGVAPPAERSVPEDPSPRNPEEVGFDDVPSGYIESDDEEDPEERDIRALFCAKLAKLMVQGPDKEPESLAKSPVEVKSTPTPKPMIGPFQNLQRLLNVTRSNPKSAKPFISWWDTAQEVTLTIHLRDVQVHELEVTDDNFTFKTSLRGTDYEVDEQLYASVREKVVENQVQCLTVLLKKQQEARWPRLTSVKRRYIKYDLNQIDDSDDDADIPCDVKVIDRGNEAYDDASEESSDSEDEEMHVKSWKKLSDCSYPYD